MNDEQSNPARPRPFVMMNAAESADGKISPVGPGKVTFGSDEDRHQMELLRAEADGVIIGAGTLLAEDPPLLIRDPAIRAQRLAAKGSPHPLNITVCRLLPSRMEEMNFFQNPETERVVFTTTQTPGDVLERAERHARVEIVPCNTKGRIDLGEVLGRLYEIGVRQLLLEGGGELNFSMFELGFVDEVYLTICPYIFGGRTAPSPVDGGGFSLSGVRKLALKDHRVGSYGELFLRYAVLPVAPQVTASPFFPQGVDLS
jgi:riboflavin-specific deaminase-like protein